METLKIFEVTKQVSVSCVDVWSIVSPKPSRTSSSSNYKSCSPCVDLQLCQLHHELDHHDLKVLDRGNGAVSRHH